MSDTTLSLEEKVGIKKSGGVLEKLMSSKEKYALAIATDFIENLQEEMFAQSNLGGNLICGIIEQGGVASYQADVYIESIIQKHNDVIYLEMIVTSFIYQV